jgi:photosystem II stability/assembly factor-like uncharacterized protein
MADKGAVRSIADFGFRLFAALAFAGLGFFPPTAADAAPAPDDGLAALHFRHLGPMGNRADAVVGVPGDPGTLYYGAASGGIWKSVDGGVHFKPVFDAMDAASIGALAIAPSEPNTVWAGTGESYIIRGYTGFGDGIYKSTDAGANWQHMGLDETGHIAQIIVDPRNPQVVYACAIGQAYRPNAERGVFRTEDGGKTWAQVLKINDTTGCSSISMDAQDPQTLFAGAWPLQIKPWDLDSGGPEGGVFVTHDGGTTWARVAGHGLPAKGSMIGRVTVRVAPGNGKVVYVLMQGPKGNGLLYRSSNGGTDWTLAHETNELAVRPAYFMNFAVSPANEDELYFVSQSFLVSLDGGRTLLNNSRRGASPKPAEDPRIGNYVGGDTHDIWIDPKNPDRIMTANDFRGDITLNGGKSWAVVDLPIAQIYHVYTDNEVPYNVIGNRQDADGVEGPSRVLTHGFGSNGFIPASAWHGYAGCESGFGVPDPTDSNIIWTGCYNGDLMRTDRRTGQTRNVAVWPVATYGAPPSEARDRWNWTFPIDISPADHNRVYVGSQYVYETTDAGQHWQRISPDLTTGKNIGGSGGLTADNLMTFSSATLAIIDESPVTAGVIWAGSFDGQVQLTRDGGKHWTNVSANIKGLPAYSTINLEASGVDAGTAYVSADARLMGDYAPYIFKTTDYGKTWKNISGDIPHSKFSFVHVVRADPVRKGMLYAGTDNALYVSWDDGAHWQRLRNNFPPAPVSWLTVEPRFNDLVISTYGRGIWILDDITALRSWPEVAKAGAAHLFDPRPAYRFRTVVTSAQDYPNGVTMGENAADGADLNYYLPAAAAVTLTIADSTGKTVRTLHENGKPGLNRVTWNLRYPPLTKATLLTSPPGKDWLETPDAGRPLVVWGGPSPAEGPRVLPGAFTVSLAVGGSQAGSAKLQVLPDPKSWGDATTMRAGQALLLQISDEINQTAQLINELEATRKQVGTLLAKLPEGHGTAAVKKAADALSAKAAAIEGRLFYFEGGGNGTEISFQGSPQLYEKLGSLYNNLQDSGRYNTGAELGPTAAQVEVNKTLAQTLASIRQAVDAFQQKDVAAFNAVAKANGVAGIAQ